MQLQPITWRKVSFGVLPVNGQEREYYVSNESHCEDAVFIFSSDGGDMKVPIEDLPLLVAALEEFMPQA